MREHGFAQCCCVTNAHIPSSAQAVIGGAEYIPCAAPAGHDASRPGPAGCVPHGPCLRQSKSRARSACEPHDLCSLKQLGADACSTAVSRLDCMAAEFEARQHKPTACQAAAATSLSLHLAAMLRWVAAWSAVPAGHDQGMLDTDQGSQLCKWLWLPQAQACLHLHLLKLAAAAESRLAAVLMALPQSPAGPLARLVLKAAQSKL